MACNKENHEPEVIFISTFQLINLPQNHLFLSGRWATDVRKSVDYISESNQRILLTESHETCIVVALSQPVSRIHRSSVFSSLSPALCSFPVMNLHQNMVYCSCSYYQLWWVSQMLASRFLNIGINSSTDPSSVLILLSNFKLVLQKQNVVLVKPTVTLPNTLLLNYYRLTNHLFISRLA